MFAVCVDYKPQTGSHTQSYFFTCKTFVVQFGHYLTQCLFIAFAGKAVVIPYNIAHIVNASRLDGENLIIWL